GFVNVVELGVGEFATGLDGWIELHVGEERARGSGFAGLERNGSVEVPLASDRTGEAAFLSRSFFAKRNGEVRVKPDAHGHCRVAGVAGLHLDLQAIFTQAPG